MANKNNIHSTRLSVVKHSNARLAKGGAVTIFTDPGDYRPTAVYFNEHILASQVISYGCSIYIIIVYIIFDERRNAGLSFHFPQNSHPNDLISF